MGKVAYWLQIISNIAIVVGLVMVGVQVSQNTYLARAALGQQQMDGLTQLYLQMMGENPAQSLAKAANNPGDLTDEDLLILRSYASFWINFDDAVQFRADMDLLMTSDERVEEVLRNRTKLVWGSNEVLAAIWTNRDRIYQAGWEQVVDGEFAKVSEYDGDREFFAEVRETLSRE